MPTYNSRINVIFSPETAGFLADLAKHKHQSLSGLARELILEALELREDCALSAIAESRDYKNCKTIPHDDVYKDQ